MLHVYRKIPAVHKTIRREALTISIPRCWDWRIVGSCGWPSASLPWNGRMGQSTDRFPHFLTGSLAGFKWFCQANQPSSKSVTKIVEPATKFSALNSNNQQETESLYKYEKILSEKHSSLQRPRYCTLKTYSIQMTQIAQVIFHVSRYIHS